MVDAAEAVHVRQDETLGREVGVVGFAAGVQRECRRCENSKARQRTRGPARRDESRRRHRRGAEKCQRNCQATDRCVSDVGQREPRGHHRWRRARHAKLLPHELHRHKERRAIDQRGGRHQRKERTNHVARLKRCGAALRSAQQGRCLCGQRRHGRDIARLATHKRDGCRESGKHRCHAAQAVARRDALESAQHGAQRGGRPSQRRP
mmetsp:Transcript_3785/g.11799  ORF Transcript_3785/g.11799 Transcript_3785/m.11799 type:complete len:207 (+) Transcript_3785:712-1332(+)